MEQKLERLAGQVEMLISANFAQAIDRIASNLGLINIEIQQMQKHNHLADINYQHINEEFSKIKTSTAHPKLGKQSTTHKLETILR